MSEFKKFESIYRKARRAGGADNEILHAFIAELGGGDNCYRSWLWNLKNDVHLHKSQSFKELCRKVYVSYNEISWEYFYGNKGDA